MALICLISRSCGGDYNICKEVELHSQLDSTLPFCCDDCFVSISFEITLHTTDPQNAILKLKVEMILFLSVGGASLIFIR